MLDLGIVARRLRSASDRREFYRLIEASLYGGIFQRHYPLAA
ncbi:hypothetical protein ACNKHQ_05410 [Shigella flexneri]